MRHAPSRSDASGRRPATLFAAAVALVAACMLTPAAHAQLPASAPNVLNTHPTWAELSPVNQRILTPLQPLWDRLPEINRRKWLKIADRYPKLSPGDQARLQSRMAEWVKMTPQQRRLARENYQITRSLPAEKKAEAWDKYQRLPEEQKKKLAAAEKVPHRPGAVSALPSGKRLPSEPSRQLRQEKLSPTRAASVPAAQPAAPTSPAMAGAPGPVAGESVSEGTAPPAAGEAATQ